MIVLDTNVISALMLSEPDERVVAWLDARPAESLWTTTVTTFEVRLGLLGLAAGRRRRRLEETFEHVLREDLGGRVLALDDAAAREAAELGSRRGAAGRPVDVRDSLIAGIVRAHRSAIATRNVRHFEDAGVDVLNPWA